MSKKQISRKSNSELVKTIDELKKASRENDAPIWKSIANKLEGPSRNWPVVNISKLEYNVSKNGKAVIPGKIMGSGTLSKKVTVSAYSFTKSAVEKIEGAGGKCMIYNDFIKKNPTGKDVVVIG
ncbi:MAG: 50S ribosomal protein L18e [Candidatus Poseidoniales archaeon]|uniref:Large ribosomal subunit protein eL18 n=1 Tax=Marine Group III euryarchaeote CG-Epi6 TaxID=1889000 RepID=A0A1J5T5Q4_9ARCH|nr:MAG: 50S ribosomal protein L18e [Marine Group III euryarchaeote CG-Epi6]|tara:strand:+ start:569 stop:940 length:372 start_codon:yes stop_codon:yes gene_type:complete